VDVVRLVFAAVVLGGALVVARRSAGQVASVEDDLLRAMSRFVPLRPRDAAVGLAQWAAVVVPAAAAVALLALRRFRALILAVIAAALAALVTAALGRAVLDDTHPFGWAFVLVEPRWLTTAAFPSPAYLAGAAAVVAALAPWLPRAWRRVAWAAVVLLVVVRIAGGTELPLDAVVALATGLGAGALVLLVAGAPRRRPDLRAVARTLAPAGLQPRQFEIVGEPASDDALTLLRALTADGPVVVEARSADARSRDLLYRLWRRARPRGPADRELFTSLRAGTEHQALAATWARRAGARTPQIVAVGTTRRRDELLVRADRGERALADFPPDELTEGVLALAWAEVGKLHDARIAHGAPTLSDLYVDRAGRAGVANLRDARLGASGRQRAADTAQLLVASARTVGVAPAIAASEAGLGPAKVAAAARLLEPVALEQATGTGWRHEAVLGQLRAQLSGAGSDEPDGGGVRGRVAALVLGASLAFYLALPALARATGLSGAARDLDLGLLLPAAVAVVLVPAAWALAMAGAAALRVPLAELYRLRLRVVFADAFTRDGSGGRGGAGRFLAAVGFEPRERDGALALLSVTSAASLVLLFLVLVVWSDNTPGPDFDLPSSSTALVVIGGALAAVGMVWRLVRRRARSTVRALGTGTLAAARRVLDSPARTSLLVGGTLAEPLLQAFILVASVRAFGASTSYSDVGACYVAARISGALAPTPGGVGAYEAVAVAALTGFGIDPALAVLAVLVQRALGWWLVVLAGWWATRADHLRVVTR
jgi:undecaprenyl-diphosphatase